MVTVLNLIITGIIPKWAIFAPVFVPLMMRLHVDPAAVLAAYRVGDSPTNAITPMMAYFPLIVAFAAKVSEGRRRRNGGCDDVALCRHHPGGVDDSPGCVASAGTSVGFLT